MGGILGAHQPHARLRSSSLTNSGEQEVGPHFSFLPGSSLQCDTAVFIHITLTIYLSTTNTALDPSPSLVEKGLLFPVRNVHGRWNWLLQHTGESWIEHLLLWIMFLLEVG